MFMAILFKFVPQCTRTAYSVYGVADCYVTYKLILFPPFCLYFYSSLLSQSCSYGWFIHFQHIRSFSLRTVII